MTSAEFYKLVLALWGEHWRRELPKLLAKYGHCYTRQTFWNWQNDKTPVPEAVALILAEEASRQAKRAD